MSQDRADWPAGSPRWGVKGTVAWTKAGLGGVSTKFGRLGDGLDVREGGLGGGNRAQGTHRLRLRIVASASLYPASLWGVRSPSLSCGHSLVLRQGHMLQHSRDTGY